LGNAEPSGAKHGVAFLGIEIAELGQVLIVVRGVLQQDKPGPASRAGNMEIGFDAAAACGGDSDQLTAHHLPPSRLGPKILPLMAVV